MIQYCFYDRVSANPFRSIALRIAAGLCVMAASFGTSLALALPEDTAEQVTEQVKTYVAVSWTNWIIAFVAVLAVLFIRRLLTWYINYRVLAHTKRTGSEVDERLVRELHRSASWLLLFVAIWVAIMIVPIPNVIILTLGKTTYSLREVLQQATLTLIAFFAARFLNWLVESLVIFTRRRTTETGAQTDEVLMPLLRDSLKVLLWIFTALVIVQVWGFNITTLIAGLGIGGLAVAFAAQDTISNVFGSVTVLLDKPFEVGDWVKLDEYEGTVEEVGIRSTRIRTVQKTQITLPNSKITSSVIENFTRMNMRRVKLTIGLARWTQIPLIEAFIEGVKEILRNHEGIVEDTQTVSFDEIRAYDFAILVVYFTKSTVWAEHLQVKQEINLALLRLAENLGIDLAYPTTVEFGAQLKKAAEKSESS
jgi:MscS family membrane protein